MRVTKTPYEGDSGSDVDDDAGPGFIITVAEGERAYRFDVADRTPHFAVADGAMFDGRRVDLVVHAPYAAGSPVIAIPKGCAVFRSAIAELERLGVGHVSFFDRRSGGYLAVPIDELIAD